MIVRAVLGPDVIGAVVADSDMLDLIATSLMQAEAGKQTLLLNGYGIVGQPLDAIAQLVPKAATN
jgi:hypothetical protein